MDMMKKLLNFDEETFDQQTFDQFNEQTFDEFAQIRD
jgi:hypothetical protein